MLIEGDSFNDELNCSISHLQSMLEFKKIKRLHCHSGFTLSELKDFCQEHDFILLDGSRKQEDLIKNSNILFRFGTNERL